MIHDDRKKWKADRLSFSCVKEPGDFERIPWRFDAAETWAKRVLVQNDGVHEKKTLGD